VGKPKKGEGVKSLKNVLKGVLLTFTVFIFGYSVLGILGGPTDGPMFVWSALWYPSQPFGVGRVFGDELLNVLLFGGICGVWAWRAMRRRPTTKALALNGGD
jgi:hypothetical protein